MYLYVQGPLDLQSFNEPQGNPEGGKYQDWGDITINGVPYTQMVWTPTPDKYPEEIQD